ncbi:MAG: tRNA (adenosine(37)-N6)-threonylcarbamoyltransferase complex dimerization subunit type 1 TsaB [Lachnospiraceae bacterium]|nr:tRNA (adenosine(37)-N6)-threonylcarbamoyltransferase complex dimerization subunit type 1 TsaB [Lachnospiraceae bacterium]
MSIRIGIDASQSVASCAISTDVGIIASATIERPIENFPTLTRDVIARANICLNDIDEIVVCIGPGSQTGIRTAVVTGNALALALNKPVSGVLSTDAAAVISKSDETYKVAISAGRRRWFIEDYSWQNGRLNRLGTLKLVDDLPESIEPSFYAIEDKSDNEKNCAVGILMIAEQQRHLISQLMLGEVRPYEYKD